MPTRLYIHIYIYKRSFDHGSREAFRFSSSRWPFGTPEPDVPGLRLRRIEVDAIFCGQMTPRALRK